MAGRVKQGEEEASNSLSACRGRRIDQNIQATAIFDMDMAKAGEKEYTKILGYSPLSMRTQKEVRRADVMYSSISTLRYM